MNIAELAIKRPIFVVMIVISILTLGIIGYTSMGVDMLPDVEYPSISIITVYEGASAEEIESLVTEPLEDSIATVEGLDTLSSSSKENISQITAAFGLGTDVKYAESKVRDAVNKAKWKLPDDADEPSVMRFTAADMLPVIALSIKGKKDLASLKENIDDKIKPVIEKIAGVARVDIWGGRDRIVKITVDKAALQARAVSIAQIMEAVGKENLNYPAGSIDKEKSSMTVRVKGKYETLADIGETPIKTYTGDTVRIKDVARVEFDLSEEQRRSRIDGENGIIFGVYKQSGENTVAIAHEVKKKIKEIQKELPVDISVQIFRDPAKHIEESIKGLQEDIGLGALAAMLIVWLFLGNFRSTLITAIALPNSLLGAFFFINYAGFTINMMVLLALSLSIGLLIDDSIVVRENIFRYIEKGLKPKEAAIKGTNEVALAVVATTASIMAVFIPISFLEGVVGQFFKQFGVTVAFALGISLIDAFTTAPMLSAYWWKKQSDEKAKIADYKKLAQKKPAVIAAAVTAASAVKWATDQATEKWNAFYDRAVAVYRQVLDWSLGHKKSVLFTVLGLLAASVGAAAFIGMSFLPDSDYGEVEFVIEGHPAATLDMTDKKLAQIEEYIKSVPQLGSYYVVAGEGGDKNKGRVFVSVKKGEKNSTKLADEIISHIEKTMGQDIVVVNEDVGAAEVISGSGGNYPITINITGPDIRRLEDLSREIKKVTQETTGVGSIDSSYRPGKPEIAVKIDRVKAAKLGLSTYETGALLNTLMTGREVTSFRRGDREYSVILQMDKADLKDAAALRDITLTTTQGIKVPLGAVASFEFGSGPVEIKRENKKRIIKVTGSVKDGYALGDVINNVKNNLKQKVRLPDGYDYKFAGQATQMSDTLSQMAKAMLLALLFMYMILASLYNSMVKPLILMLSVPLAVIGAFLALLLTGQKMDIMAMIGLLMVLGLVAKNGILLIDFTDQNVKAGMSPRQALLHAGPIRLRPILMTTFAMIFGMMPLAIGLGEGALRTRSMPIAVIGGLLTSTFLTLVVIPVVYEWVEGIKMQKVKGKR